MQYELSTAGKFRRPRLGHRTRGKPFGSENVPQTEVNRIIAAALDLGINFIDTSNNYTAGH